VPAGTVPQLTARLCVAVCALLLAAIAVTAQGASTLEESIRVQQDKAEAGKQEVLRLTKQERALYKDLADVEDATDKLQDEIRRKESDLAAIRAEIGKATSKGKGVSARMDETRQELDGLLAALWPLHLKREAGRTEPASAWTEADRRFTWTASLYDGVGQKLTLLENQAQELGQVIDRQKRLQRQASETLEEIEKDRDKLLEDKLAFVRKIREVRAERVSREQALEDILGAIDELNYRLKLSRGGDFKDLKGRLPSPVDAEVAQGFGKTQGPAGRGISFKLPDDTPVKSIFWGKVVHDDVLRGFGRVVIVYHGGNYYSLYAYLSQSLTALGREVEKGEPLGLSGFYPGVNGPGLYFELRFKQKAINPEDWLALR
jgi:septal ring factor EnvC (AmiA/AmiB activator)